MKLVLKILKFSILITNLAPFTSSWRNSPPRIKIKQGIIEGISHSGETSRQTHAFLGIPYAVPPTDFLRFSPPKFHQGWNGTFQAKTIKPACPQLNLKDEYSEDCLYVDIWTPQINSSYRYPVLVHIGGVDFSRNSQLDFNGQELSSKGIIVIRINYRLNIFGFFCLGSPELRGNLGLLDQYFAMVWIKENIVYFGGDPEKITLFGHYSGGVSVTLHMISSRTKGLFQKAVISSGSATAPWSINGETIKFSREILQSLKCSSDTSNCLRRKTTKEILQTYEILSKNLNKTDIFLPVFDTFLESDERYLPVSTFDNIREKAQLIQVPLLIGVGTAINYPETEEWINLLSQGYYFLKGYVEKRKIPKLIDLYGIDEKVEDLLKSMIGWEYSLFLEKDGRFLINQLKKMEFEAKLKAPSIKEITFMSKFDKQSVYAYVIEDLNIITEIPDKSITADMLMLTGENTIKKITRRKINSEITRLSERFQNYFINFIIHGNPAFFERNAWRTFTQQDPYIQMIPQQSPEDLKNQNKRIHFWNELIKKFNDLQINNMPQSIEFNNTMNTASGLRNVILCGLLVVLLALLVLCIVLLRHKSKNRSETQWTIS